MNSKRQLTPLGYGCKFDLQSGKTLETKMTIASLCTTQDISHHSSLLRASANILHVPATSMIMFLVHAVSTAL